METIKTYLVFKQSDLDTPVTDLFVDTRVTNAVLRFFARRGVEKPTVEQLIDAMPEFRQFKSVGKTTLRKISKKFIEMALETMKPEDIRETIDKWGDQL